MRRKKNGGSDDDSLDLLLDTICNTFGGILLIALLVSVLANMVSDSVALEPPEHITQGRMIELQQELEREKEELRLLQVTVKQQKEIRIDFTNLDSIRLANDLRDVRHRLANTTNRNSSILNSTSKLQKQTNEIATKLDEQNKKLTQLKHDLKITKSELSREIRKRTRKAKLPTVSKWSEGIVNSFLKNGRFCVLQIPRNGFLIINSKECIISKKGTRETIGPKLSAGLEIDVRSKDSSSIVSKMKVFDPKLHLIRIWVTPDSFKEFAKLRDALVSLNFRYEIRPIPQNQLLSQGGGGSSRVRAQ